MRLEQQVCSLELAKKLKDLGVKQESFWSWYDTIDRDDSPRLNRSDENCSVCTLAKQNWEEKISAFTVAELGEMLPAAALGDFFRTFKMVTGTWEAAYGVEKTLNASTEADARAKMLTYLIENNLLERVA